MALLLADVAATGGGRCWLYRPRRGVLPDPVAQALVVLVPLAFLVYPRPLAVAARDGAGGRLAICWRRGWSGISRSTAPSAADGLGRSLVARDDPYDEGASTSRGQQRDGDPEGRGRQFTRGKRNTIRNSRSVSTDGPA